jgi:hypothetical protein
VIARLPTASDVFSHGFCRLTNVRENSGLTPLAGESAQTHIASDTSSVAPPPNAPRS